MYNDNPPQRKPWKLPFEAEPEEVSALRRLMRLHLGLWGLQDVIEAAQLCVTELVSNVVTHVGPGTPATLAVSMSGPHLRIEVHDPDTRALPTLMEVACDSEGGRGMALVEATAVRWGVELHADRKVTWCELATESALPWSVDEGPRLRRAEGLLDLYTTERTARVTAVGAHRLSVACAEETAIEIISDLLHWFHAHGRDADEVLERAQVHFETEAGAAV
ncbi:ATP-binding protein [Streptomyces nodosus]|uniref:ATP-binding protein n=1 Tax=Streptomyces nodosus TaxID=40318 RepID=UPI0036E25ACC